MNLVWLALIGATCVTGALLLLAVAIPQTRSRWNSTTARVLAAVWVGNLIFDLVLLYSTEPPLTGMFGGWQWLLWPAFFTGMVVLLPAGLTLSRRLLDSLSVPQELVAAGAVGADSERAVHMREVQTRRQGASATLRRRGARAGALWERVRAAQLGLAGSALAAVVLMLALGINGWLALSTTGLTANAQALAAIPQIRVASSAQQLPATDLNMLNVVPRYLASSRAQAALTKGGDTSQPPAAGSLAANYHVDVSNLTLQSVHGHLYWLAPLVANDLLANLGNWTTPGYVVVDAQSPKTPVKVRLGYTLRYFSEAPLSGNLLRHVYLSGYTSGNAEDVLFAVDNSWRPYYTLSLMQQKQGTTGQVLAREVVVDAQTGAISTYALGHAPGWVDREIPGGEVQNYVNWWGAETTSSRLPAAARKHIYAAGSPMLVFPQPDHAEWLVPTTNQKPSAGPATQATPVSPDVTGVVLFDARGMTGTYYPLSNLGSMDAAARAIEYNPHNLSNVDVTILQLTQVYGVPTWVASISRGDQSSATFQSIALLDAHTPASANAQFGQNMTQALANYAQWLTLHHAAPASAPTGKPVTVQGVIDRIASANAQGTTVYSLHLAGHAPVYLAGLPVSAALPLAHTGDTVRLTYLSTGQGQLTVSSFDDLTLSGARS